MSRHKMLHCNIVVKRRGRGWIAAVALAATVASCTWFEGDPPPAEGDGDYPNLADVPDRPDVESLREASAIKEGLRSDRANARYTEAPLKSSTAAGVEPPPPTSVELAEVSTEASVIDAPGIMASEVAVTAAEVRATVPAPDAGTTIAVPANPAAEPPSMVAGAVSPIAIEPPPPAPVQTTETSITAPPPAPPAIAPAAPPAVPMQTAAIQTPAPIPAPPSLTAPAVAPSSTYSGDPSVIVNPIDSQGLPTTGAPLPASVIYFGNNSATISASEAVKIRQVAQARAARQARLRVIGHASMRTANMRPIEHDRTNLEISWARANAVADALRRQGVPIELIVVTAVSDTQPVYLENMPAGEAGNRRVEIYLE